MANIVILTGAGISAESGLKTFRDQDGLWENHPIEAVATPEGYQANPQLVREFYNARWKQLKDADVAPNAAHQALARLEAEHQGRVTLVTQNVDDLHERAGSRRVIHMHGQLTKARCPVSQQVFPKTEPFSESTVCTCCIPHYPLRPHIVWFGEMPLQMERIENELAQCDLFISIGTSGSVYPAAGFVELANQLGAQTIELNLEPSQVASQFQQTRYGRASETVVELVEQILKSPQ
ncbi:Sir2 family NAD+-dependent deacetylase [Paraferrimonas sedimenticola]|uniref:NAD-dependent protein deacylase n=1 Tax=Paraferrimonas sedimenticola TaxID=375674 RepID=A0AA37RSC5_9GAMM|nr:Sir2 family NAD+-dependent deacetylase [Paraferrimonas sedimenticola]GLP94804.1 NAD-dependent protein deacylase [Paraferrimonas sedimenticola]